MTYPTRVVDAPLFEEFLRHSLRGYHKRCKCGFRFFDDISEMEFLEHLCREVMARFEISASLTPGHLPIEPEVSE